MSVHRPKSALLRPCLIALVILGLVELGLVVPAGAATADVGYFGPTYSGLEPTGSKPESKLWFHDGAWWSIMRDAAKTANRIFRLDRATGQWSDTGVVVETRTSHADVLWDGTTLAVATHVFSSTSGNGGASYLYTFTYDAARKTWVKAGGAGSINSVKGESLVIARDSTKRLWATWAQGGKIYVNRSTTDDRTWGTPYVLPATGIDVDADDLSSIIAFGGNRIGVLWSNQKADTFSFAIHEDGAPDNAWRTEVAASGGLVADDHVNLKTDAAGNVYAAVKTSRTSASATLIALLVRSAAGSWSFTSVATVRESNTRPIVLLDEEQRKIHVLMTGPQAPSTNGQSGGDIVEKTSSMDDLAFGAATPLIHREANPYFSDVTSTKQNVSAATGLVALASENYAKIFGTSVVELGSTPPPPPPAPPTASFTVSPSSGVAPLTTQFTDTSAGSPTSWSWLFGDGTSSTERHPQHVYQAAGSYTVTLTATNAGGSTTVQQVGAVNVDAPPPPPPPPPAPTSLTVVPTADAYVASGSPTTNAGASTYLRSQVASTTYRSYVQFDVGALAGTVTSAKLRIYATASASTGGGAIYRTATGWGERTITWANAPAPTGTALGSIGATTTGTWYEVDVTAAVTGAGSYAFVLADGGSAAAWFNSREGANPPQLVVTSA
jgi:PKD repeat protein